MVAAVPVGGSTIVATGRSIFFQPLKNPTAQKESRAGRRTTEENAAILQSPTATPPPERLGNALSMFSQDKRGVTKSMGGRSGRGGMPESPHLRSAARSAAACAWRCRRGPPPPRGGASARFRGPSSRRPARRGADGMWALRGGATERVSSVDTIHLADSEAGHNPDSVCEAGHNPDSIPSVPKSGKLQLGFGKSRKLSTNATAPSSHAPAGKHGAPCRAWTPAWFARGEILRATPQPKPILRQLTHTPSGKNLYFFGGAHVFGMSTAVLSRSCHHNTGCVVSPNDVGHVGHGCDIDHHRADAKRRATCTRMPSSSSMYRLYVQSLLVPP